jgi:uncharacterized protein YbjT (DUF2867 family)
VTEEALVLGATGTTGSRVGEALARKGIQVRAATRKPLKAGQVRFDWADAGTHRPALLGVSAAYVVAPIGVADPGPLVEPFLHEAVRAGVRRVVLLSSSAVPEGAPGLGVAHRLVREIVPEWTVLRPSWFMQNFTGQHPHAQGVAAGEVVTATGSGRVGFVDAGDIAAVAARALTGDYAHGGELVLTGPEALSYADAVALIAKVAGRAIRHRSVEGAEFAALLTAQGYPQDVSAMLAELDVDIAAGAEDRVTSTVEDVTGRPARSFQHFVEDNWKEIP